MRLQTILVLASQADVLLAYHTILLNDGTHNKALRTSAWEAKLDSSQSYYHYESVKLTLSLLLFKGSKVSAGCYRGKHDS